MDVLTIGQIIEAMNTEGMTNFVYESFLVPICRLSSTGTHIMKKRSSHDRFVFVNHIPNKYPLHIQYWTTSVLSLWLILLDIGSLYRNGALLLYFFRVSGGVLVIWQGWRWYHHDDRAGGGNAVIRTKPDRGGATGHAEWGRFGR